MKYLQYILSAVRGWREPQATKQTNKSRPLGVAHLLAALVIFPSVLFGAATVKWTASDFTAQPLAVKRITMQPLAYATNATSVITLDRRTVSTDSSGVAWFSNVVAGTYRSTLEGPNTTTTITNNIPDGSGIVEAKDTIGVSTNASGTVAYSQAAANSRFVLKSGDTMTGALTNASGFYYNGERLTNSAAGVSQTNWPYTAITNAPWTTNASDPNAITNWDTRLLNLTNVATLSLTNLEFRGTTGIRFNNTNGTTALEVKLDGSGVFMPSLTVSNLAAADSPYVRMTNGTIVTTGNGTIGGELTVSNRVTINPNATSGTNWLNHVTQFGAARTNTISDGGSVINGVGHTNGYISGVALPSSGMTIQMDVLGDSVGNSLSPFIYSNSISAVAWPTWAVYLSGGRIQMVGNNAVPGYKTSELVNRSGNVLVNRPTHVPIYVGINDVNTGTPTVSAAMTNLAAVVDDLKSRQIIPILCGLAPFRYDEFYKQDKWNTEVRKLAQERRVPFVDFFSDCAEPGTNIFRVGETRDFIHPNQLGARRMAEVFLKSFGVSPDMSDQNQMLAQSQHDTNNVIANGLFLDLDSDGAADNWTTYATNSETVSLIADADVRGNWLSISKPTIDGTCIVSNNIAWTGFSAADKIQFSGRVWLENVSAETNGGLVIGCRFVGGGANEDAELAPVYYITNSIPRHGVFSFQGKAITGAAGVEVTVRMINMSGTARVAQLKLVNTSRLTTMAEPETRLESRGGGVRVSVSAGNVGLGTAPTAANRLEINGSANLSSTGILKWGTIEALAYYNASQSHLWGVRLPQNSTNVHLYFGAPTTATSTNWGRISFTGPTNAPAFEFKDGAASNTIPIVVGGQFIRSNSLAMWPTVPRAHGEAYIGNSNGVLYILTSVPGTLEWATTNKLAP